MNVIAAVLTGQGDYTNMKHFTIDTENNITIHASRKAARETGAAVFSTEVQFADLIGPDNKRLVEIWNSLPGVKPVTKFTNRKVATERIWKAVQGLGELAAAPASEPQDGAIEVALEDAAPQTTSEPAGTDPADQPAEAAEPVATVGAQAAKGAPAKPKATKKTTPAKKAPMTKKAAKTQESAGPREGSKTAEVVALLQRKNGATLAEIMETTGWLSHTTRAFVSATLGKKLGLAVESFKSDKGERTYRING